MSDQKLSVIGPYEKLIGPNHRIIDATQAFHDVTAYSCDFGHSFLLKTDSQSRFIRTPVPEQNGHFFQHSFSQS
jgi:hypothetical protein